MFGQEEVLNWVNGSSNCRHLYYIKLTKLVHVKHVRYSSTSTTQSGYLGLITRTKRNDLVRLRLTYNKLDDTMKHRMKIDRVCYLR